MSLWGITKTFTGKQALSCNRAVPALGGGKQKKRWHIRANLSGGAVKKRCRLARDDVAARCHLETSADTPFERELVKQACQGLAFNTWCVPPVGAAAGACNSDAQLRYTNKEEKKNTHTQNKTHVAQEVAHDETRGLLGCKVGQRLVSVVRDVGT